MDRLEAMALFREVVEKGSFSAAGRSLRVPLATLSRKISDLEALLGTRLLIRTTRRLSLTDVGVAYLETARRVLDLVEDAERQAAGEFVTPKGELIITAPLMFGRVHVLPVVTDFLALFPEIAIRLLLSDRNIHLVADNVDMAVRIGELADSSMIATRIGSMRTVVCAAPSLLAGHRMPRSPADLRDFPCVTVDAPMPSQGCRFAAKNSISAVEIPILSRLSVTTPEAAMHAAIRGAGVARLLYYQVADAVASGSLKVILKNFEPKPAPVHLVHVARGLMPLKMRRFLDFATPRLRRALNELEP